MLVRIIAFVHVCLNCMMIDVCVWSLCQVGLRLQIGWLCLLAPLKLHVWYWLGAEKVKC